MWYSCLPSARMHFVFHEPCALIVRPRHEKPCPPAWKEMFVTSFGLPHRHSIGINRRELLQVGYSGLLGISLPMLYNQRAVSAEVERAKGEMARKPKSVIIIFLTGAPSHLDMF